MEQGGVRVGGEGCRQRRNFRKTGHQENARWFSMTLGFLVLYLFISGAKSDLEAILAR